MHDSDFCINVSSINSSKLLLENIITFTCLLYFNCIFVCVIDRMYCSICFFVFVENKGLLTDSPLYTTYLECFRLFLVTYPAYPENLKKICSCVFFRNVVYRRGFAPKRWSETSFIYVVIRNIHTCSTYLENSKKTVFSARQPNQPTNKQR